MNRFGWLLAVSVVLHALVASWLVDRWMEQYGRSSPEQRAALQVDLEMVEAPTTTVIPVPEPRIEPVRKLIEPSVIRSLPEIAVSPKQEPAAALDTMPPALDLDRQWLHDALQANSPRQRGRSEQQQLLQAFRPEAEQRLESEQRRRDARQLLAQRARERDGVAPEDYQSQNRLGDVVKTEQGCFAAHRTPGLNGMETRWWRTGCGEPRKSVWEQSVLSFDGNGSSDP